MSDIDVLAFARDLNVITYSADLPPDVRVAMNRAADGAIELHFNAADPVSTQRYAVAHALSLYWRNIDRSPDFGYVVRSEHLIDCARDPESAAANRFAGALLPNIGPVSLPHLTDSVATVNGEPA